MTTVWVQRGEGGAIGLWSEAEQFGDHWEAIDSASQEFQTAVTPGLALVKARLKAAIDVAAEIERLKYITAGAGQAMTYQQKADEAKRLLADPAPSGSNYPLLSAELGITAPTLADVAGIVNAAFLQWQVIGGAIEGVRLGAKAAIEAASTVEDAKAVADAVAWPDPSTGL